MISTISIALIAALVTTYYALSYLLRKDASGGRLHSFEDGVRALTMFASLTIMTVVSLIYPPPEVSNQEVFSGVFLAISILIGVGLVVDSLRDQTWPSTTRIVVSLALSAASLTISLLLK